MGGVLGRNTHFSLAVHALTILGVYQREAGVPAPSEKLAESLQTNASFLRQLLGELAQSGLIETRRGKGGGTVLARPASEITLLDIFRATEGQVEVNAHPLKEAGTCPVGHILPDLWTELSGKLDDVVAHELAAVTLADVMGRVPAQAR